MEKESKKSGALGFSQVYSTWDITSAYDGSGLPLVWLTKTGHYAMDNVSVDIETKARRLMRKIGAYPPIGKIQKIVFFGERLVWMDVIKALADKHQEVFLRQELISEILIRISPNDSERRHGLFTDDTLIYHRSGSYHGYLLFKEHRTIYIVDVCTIGLNRFQVKISKLKDFILNHPSHSAPYGKDCHDFFIIPVAEVIPAAE